MAGSPSILASPVSLVGICATLTNVAVRSLSGRVIDLPAWPSSGQSYFRSAPDLSRYRKRAAPSGPVALGGERKSSTISGRSAYVKAKRAGLTFLAER